MAKDESSKFAPFAIYLKPGENLVEAHRRARDLVRQTAHSVVVLC